MNWLHFHGSDFSSIHRCHYLTLCNNHSTFLQRSDNCADNCAENCVMAWQDWEDVAERAESRHHGRVCRSARVSRQHPEDERRGFLGGPTQPHHRTAILFCQPLVPAAPALHAALEV